MTRKVDLLRIFEFFRFFFGFFRFLAIFLILKAIFSLKLDIFSCIWGPQGPPNQLGGKDCPLLEQI